VTFDHRTFGTCDDATCPLHGRCHCGCGKRANIVPYGRWRQHQTSGMPAVYRAGHNPKPHRPLPPIAYVNSARNGKRKYVPVDRVAPLARWLRDQYGSYHRAAKATGLNRGPLTRWGQRKVTCVHPDGVRELVNVIRRHHPPTSTPWDNAMAADVTPRALTTKRRDAERRRRHAAERRRQRKKDAA
jgi:hypothetical protein